MKILTISEIKPFVRLAQYYTHTKNTTLPIQLAYDHRLYLCVSGNGNLSLNNIDYTILPGTLIMWGPMIPYQFKTESKLELLCFNFSFTPPPPQLQEPIRAYRPGITPFYDSFTTESVSFSDITEFNTPLVFTNMSYLRNKLEEIENEFSLKKLYYKQRCSVMFSDIIVNIAQRAKISSMPSAKMYESANDIINYLKDHFAEDITNETLGKIFNYHPNYINKIIKKTTGLSVHQYLINLRISKAILLLQTGLINVSDTAVECGFNNATHFSNCIKNKTGHSPSWFVPK